jgi:hypothetical protein
VEVVLVELVDVVEQPPALVEVQQVHDVPRFIKI